MAFKCSFHTRHAWYIRSAGQRSVRSCQHLPCLEQASDWRSSALQMHKPNTHTFLTTTKACKYASTLLIHTCTVRWVCLPAAEPTLTFQTTSNAAQSMGKTPTVEKPRPQPCSDLQRKAKSLGVAAACAGRHRHYHNHCMYRRCHSRCWYRRYHNCCRYKPWRLLRIKTALMYPSVHPAIKQAHVGQLSGSRCCTTNQNNSGGFIAIK